VYLCVVIAVNEVGFEWLLEVALLLALAKTLELVSVKIGLLRVVAWLLAGLIVSGLRAFVAYEPSSALRALAQLGIILLLFEAGLEGSLRTFVRGLKRASLVAIGGVLGAVLSGLAAVPILGMPLSSGLALGVILSATSVSVTVRTFEELGALSSVEAQTIVGAAVVDDVVGLALLGLISGAAGLGSIAIFAPAAFGLWFATAIVADRASKGLFKAVLSEPIEAGAEATALILTLLLAYIAMRVGLSAILLAYAFGMGIAGFRYAARRIGERLRVLALLFAPLFFVYAGYQVDLQKLASIGFGRTTMVVAVVLALAFISKILGCYIPARLSGLGGKSSLVVGVGMAPRAEVMAIAATLALERGVIDQSLYLALLLVVPVTSFVTPIIIRKLYS